MSSVLARALSHELDIVLIVKTLPLAVSIFMFPSVQCNSNSELTPAHAYDGKLD